jgi:hypothetical protein
MERFRLATRRESNVGATSLPDANSSIDPKDPRLAGHLPVLDGVRGIAILGVVIFHAVAFEVHNRMELAFGMAANFGWAGVDLFFVLSGFLITSILLRARGGANYYRAFYIRRCRPSTAGTRPSPRCW